MKIYVKKVDGLVLPERGTERATGYDIVATSEPKIVGQKYTPVGYESSEVGNEWLSIDYIQYETNLFIAPETLTHDVKIYPRSSARKYNLNLANCVPIIDNDYRGMIYLCFNYLWQPGDFRIVDNKIVGTIDWYKIYNKGDKIAQMTLDQVIPIDFVVVDDLTKTQRGAGGFGSTDATKGKTLMEVFEAEQKPSVAKIAEEALSILDKYNKAGGIPTPTPYIEQIKQRDNS